MCLAASIDLETYRDGWWWLENAVNVATDRFTFIMVKERKGSTSDLKTRNSTTIIGKADVSGLAPHRRQKNQPDIRPIRDYLQYFPEPQQPSILILNGEKMKLVLHHMDKKKALVPPRAKRASLQKRYSCPPPFLFFSCASTNETDLTPSELRALL
ncbi:hypothetical protein BGW80DRAFT_484155 [Lactifluus volemus]|nr:hypothetical protein BGW80DRAFT_484155 [Lactifluus volemus]